MSFHHDWLFLLFYNINSVNRVQNVVFDTQVNIVFFSKINMPRARKKPRVKTKASTGLCTHCDTG